MNKFIVWYQRMIWIGIVINMTFALPALFAPDFLTSALGLPFEAQNPWLGNAGMLLVGISLFTHPRASMPCVSRFIRGYAYCRA